jgi:hypothetical protein
MMRRAVLPAFLAIALVAAALGGCASVPQADPQRDAEAKEFNSHPGSSTVYVFRNDFLGEPNTDDTVLYMDDRLIGGTLPGTFFRIDVRAGDHELHGIGYDQGSLKINTRSGEVYFVALNVVNGVSLFRQVEPETAKRQIARCCALMENWAPGQRPMLR